MWARRHDSLAYWLVVNLATEIKMPTASPALWVAVTDGLLEALAFRLTHLQNWLEGTRQVS
jgi:hypothetical protein